MPQIPFSQLGCSQLAGASHLSSPGSKMLKFLLKNHFLSHKTYVVLVSIYLYTSLTKVTHEDNLNPLENHDKSLSTAQKKLTASVFFTAFDNT
jgi:hypothetical protein